MALIRGVHASGADDLHIVSNNCGVDGWGLGVLLAAGRISRLTCSYMGEHKELARRFLAGELEVELTPQGSLAERLRAGGSGIPAFYTPAGVGTLVAEGGLPRRYNPDGSFALVSPPKELRTFGDRQYVLEEAIDTDFALVRAALGDAEGNLVFHSSARNFSPLCAMAGRTTIAEVERIVPAGGDRPRSGARAGSVRPAHRARRPRQGDRAAGRAGQGDELIGAWPRGPGRPSGARAAWW